MALLVVGLNHKTAPVAVRERLEFADQTLAEPLARRHDPATVTQPARSTSFV